MYINCHNYGHPQKTHVILKHEETLVSLHVEYNYLGLNGLLHRNVFFFFDNEVLM